MMEKPKNKPLTQEIGKRSIELIPVAGLTKPMMNLLAQMKDKIDAGNYGLIVGDDASGRIPTRIFDRILNEVNMEKGHDKIHTRFFAGSGGLTHGQMEEKTKKIVEHLKKYEYEKYVLNKNGKPKRKALFMLQISAIRKESKFIASLKLPKKGNRL